MLLSFKLKDSFSSGSHINISIMPIIEITAK